jgi:hypothetical protein
MQKVIFNTAGDGYWSNVAKAVTIVDMQLGYVSDELDFGELRVYFDTKTWNVNKDGLIYTDSKFESMLQALLCEHGIDGNDVSYSEQGMQGDNYVSLDVGKKFLASWAKKFDVNLAALALV